MPMQQPEKLFVILAIFPYNEADTVTVSFSKKDAVKSWCNFMRNGETRLSDREETWLAENATYLSTVRKTERQDSGVFYRLNPMSVIKG